MTVVKTIAGSLWDALNAGHQYIDDIVKVTGYTHAQIYYAGQELVKAQKAARPIGGKHGALVLPGQVFKEKQPAFVDMPKQWEGTPQAEVPKVIAPTVAPVLDFNNHFNTFIDSMAKNIVLAIEQRVEHELQKVSSTIEAKVMAAVTQTTESMLERINQQLSLAIAPPVVKQPEPSVIEKKVVKPTVTKAKEVVDAPVTEVKEVPAATPVEEVAVAQQPPKAPEPKKVRTRLPKVCVTGLLPAQCGELVAAFGDTFEMTFWNDRTGSRTSELKHIAQSCDAVFWHTKHASHGDEKILTNNNANLIRVKGETTAMRAALTKYYEETKQPA